MGRRSAGKPSFRPAARSAPVRNPPQPVSHAPPPAPVQARSGGSFMGNVAEGMGLGTGLELASRAVGSVLGPRTIRHETADPVSAPAPAPAPAAGSMGSDACSIHSKAFQDCLNSSGSEISKCQFYMDMLVECKRSSGSVISA